MSGGEERVPKGYKQTEIGVIPEDWDIKPAKELCRINQGLQIAIAKRLKIPSLKSKKYITIQYLNEGKVAEYIEDYSSSVTCDFDDILMTRTGNTGTVITNVEGVFHNNFFKINYDRNRLTRDFLFYYLKLETLQKIILRKAGTSTIPDINHDEFYSIPIVFPSINEQYTITNALSGINSLIELYENLITKKRDIKQGAMQELLTGKTRLPGFTEDWDTISLEEATTIGGLVRGPFGGTLKKSFFVSRGFKVYEQKNAIRQSVEVGDYFIESKKFNELKRFQIEDGDFIVSCSGTIGRIFQIPNNSPPGVINQALLKISINENIVNSDYFLAVFRSLSFQNRILDNSHGGAMPNLVGMPIFRNVIFQIPSERTEQDAIAEILSDMDAEITALELRFEKTKAIKQGMMQQLFTGRIRLVEPSTPVEASA